jgi:beta-ribofuranosylaminobenzene 5'-phosphate synthase
VAALKVPEDWRFIILIPEVGRGMSEGEEAAALREPWEPDPGSYWLMAWGTLRMASGIARGDLDDALKGLEAVQRGTGAYFSRLQGGLYRGPLVEVARRAESEGVFLAQSSWGPTLYTISYREDAVSVSETLKGVAEALGLEARVLVSEPRNEGAKIL